MFIPDELKRLKPMTGSERLGAMRDSEYLGAEDLDPDSSPVVTIAALYNGSVTLQRGKENKDVIVFQEDSVPGIKKVRPLIVNATNRKTLRKLYKAVTADALVGKRIELYLDHNVRDPSTGDKIDGIRIKARIPADTKVAPIICEQCGKPIKAIGQFSAEQIANINQKRYGKKLCGDCSKKIGEQAEAPSGQEEQKQEEKAE